MNPPDESDLRLRGADLDVLRQLPTILLREGYIDTYCVYGTLHVRFAAVREQLELLPRPVRTLMSLFFLGEMQPVQEVAEIFTDGQIQALRRLGVFMESGGRLHTGGLVLLPIGGLLMFVPAPNINPPVYFGDDSAALVAHLSPPRGARCVDFCAGPGIQALRASTAGGHVVAVEINPVALAVAELNVALNGLEDRIELRLGDLYAALRPEERFDFVSANPPLLPFAPDLPYPFVGHGGGDGLAVTRRILDKLPGILSERGTAQIIGTCLGDLDGPTPRAELARYAKEQGLHVVMTVPARLPMHPGSPMFDGLVWTCAEASGLSTEVVQRRYAEHLQQLGADHLYTFFLTISQGRARPEFQLTEHFRRPGGFWFR